MATGRKRCRSRPSLTAAPPFPRVPHRDGDGARAGAAVHVPGGEHGQVDAAATAANPRRGAAPRSTPRPRRVGLAGAVHALVLQHAVDGDRVGIRRVRLCAETLKRGLPLPCFNPASVERRRYYLSETHPGAGSGHRGRRRRRSRLGSVQRQLPVAEASSDEEQAADDAAREPDGAAGP
jgi:hypothetical protein